MVKLAPAVDTTPPEIASRLSTDPAFATAWADSSAGLRRDMSRFVVESRKSEIRERRADQVVEQVQLRLRAAADAAAEAAALAEGQAL